MQPGSAAGPFTTFGSAYAAPHNSASIGAETAATRAEFAFTFLSMDVLLQRRTQPPSNILNLQYCHWYAWSEKAPPCPLRNDRNVNIHDSAVKFYLIALSIVEYHFV